MEKKHKDNDKASESANHIEKVTITHLPETIVGIYDNEIYIVNEKQ